MKARSVLSFCKLSSTKVLTSCMSCVCNFWGELNQLVKEGDCVEKEGRRKRCHQLTELSETRGTAIQRKTKSAHVTISGFLLFYGC